MLYAHIARRSRNSRRLLFAVAFVAAIFGLAAPSAVNAAMGAAYMSQATDPHGGVWLQGALGGHLWETDVLSGLCRVDLQADGTYALARGITGGCITAGQKASQPTLDPLTNADGTEYVYTCDWATASQGCYRLTYAPSTETMLKSELLAPGRFPQGIKPFATALGQKDHKLYVSSDLESTIYRITSPNDPTTANQLSEVVGQSNDGARVRAITFACWSALRAQQGLPSCGQMAALGDPTPDLVLAQRTSVSVILNAETCQGTVFGCPAMQTSVQVSSPMGAYTQSFPTPNPDVIYVTDSPGTTSQVVRYTISTNTQDSYSNFGVRPDSSQTQYSFAFSVTQGPDGAMYLGDDPTAGASSFAGRLWRVPAGAPPDVAGTPGQPAVPPLLPAAKTGSLAGAGVTLPNDGVWLGTHLWIADGVNGFCRMDPDPVSGIAAIQPSTCSLAAAAPGQPAYDAASNSVYVPDSSTKGAGIFRFQFDPTGATCGVAETVCKPVSVAPGQGLEGQRIAGVALDPTTGTLYLGLLSRNTGAPAQIARVLNPASATATVEWVGNVTRGKQIFDLGFIGPDLYIANNGGLDVLPFVKTCQPLGCGSLQILNLIGPRGFATDGKDRIYLASPAEPAGTLNPVVNTPVMAYSVHTGDLFSYSTQGVLADNSTISAYEVVHSLTLNPTSGELYVADDPSSLGLPIQQGRVFRVPVGPQVAIPSILVRPGDPTRVNTPAFTFTSADPAATFRCSLVPLGAPDAFAACTSPATFGPVTDGRYVFHVEGVDAAGNTSIAAGYAFTVDTVAPATTLLTQPHSPTNVNTPSFTFSASEAGATFQCSLSTGADSYQPCASPFTSRPTPDGAYTFKVVSTDLAGNAGNPATTSLVIDTVAPGVVASPAGGVYIAAQSVVLTASEPATIFYTTDGTTPTTASPGGASPVTINIPGSTTLRYFATDAAGNVGTLATQTYQVGAITLTQNPPNATNKNAPAFAWADSLSGVTFQCSLVLQTAVDSFTGCTSPITYAAQPDGVYRFVVKDTSGNAATSQFTIDTTPPVVTLTQNPSNPDLSSSATFSFGANEPNASFMCSFTLQTGADAYASCTSPATFGPQSDGAYIFKVKAVDAAGNTSSVTSYAFTIQAAATPSATAPVARLDPSATTNSSASTTGVPVTLSWSGTACASGAAGCNISSYHLQESVNGGAFADVALPSPTATSIVRMLRPSPTNNSTPATSYRYQVQSTNVLGQVSAFAIAFAFTVPDVDNSFNTSFNGSWSGGNLAGAFGGSVHASSTASASANPANPLSVTSLALVSTVGPDRGIAQVLVDNVAVAVVDLYAPTQKPAQVVWTTNDLAAGSSHTVKVVVKGTRNAASTAARVDYDAILALQ